MQRDSAQEQYDKMTKTPVHQLVLRLGLPTTVSMLAKILSEGGYRAEACG